MPQNRPPRMLCLIALVAAPSLVACSSGERQPPPEAISSLGIQLEGDATQAQLSTFLDHKPREWAWAGGQFDAPDDRAPLAADTPQTFAWHADPADFAVGNNASDVAMTHLLSFASGSNASLLDVFTTLNEYTPDTAAWHELLAAHEAITVSLTTASFLGAQLPVAGGPFIGQSLTFTIE